MSKKYQPLYTKYRPMVFADITGQESTVKALSNAIESGRIMHAYLFCGPRGTGKTSSARILAKSLNCVNGPTVNPCGKCPGCLDVVNSTPVDVIEIDAASNRSVDDARNILEKVQYAPLNGKYKIYIIDEVHMLTNEASNALLKTLEEPPENVIFILATTESHKVLETIVSRCQRYDFRRITTADIIKRLEFIAKSEKIKISQDALVAIAKNAAGGMRDAVALLDQLSVLGQNNTIGVDDVNEILGQISYDTVFEIAECIKDNNTEKALHVLDDINDKGNEPGRVITALIQYFRDMLILKSCTDKNLVFSMTKINEPLYEKISEQSENFDKQSILFLIDRLSEHFAKIKENTNKFMWAELCIIDITTTQNIPELAELSEKIAKLEQMISSGVTLKPSFNPVPKPSNPVNELPRPVPPKPRPIDTMGPVAEKAAVVDMTVKKETVDVAPLPQKTYNVAENTDDMTAIWLQLTAEIKSAPARYFFSNDKLIKPLEITNSKIILGAASDGALKQANEAKQNQLKESACRYFDVPSIQVEVKKADFAALEKKNSLAAQAKKAPQAAEKQPSEIKTEPKQEQNEQVAVEPKNPKPELKTPVFSESSDDYDDSVNQGDLSPENYQSLPDTNGRQTMNIENLELSDTAKSILDLFDGQITDL